MELEQMNFIHYGHGAEQLKALVMSLDPKKTKAELLNSVHLQGGVKKEIEEVIQGYGLPYRPALNWDLFVDDLQKMTACMAYFRSLGVRGFSFQVCEDFEFSWSLRKSINFKLALMSCRHLFYPVRIHRYLPRFGWSHSCEDKYPAIAFALGRIVNDELFIFVLQSDLVFRGPAYVREHFRGWRKILFFELLRRSEGNIKRVFLNTSDSVLRTCHPGYHPPKVVPPVWRGIYEGTAAFFGMTRKKIAGRRNIQVLADLPCRYANEFYALEVSSGRWQSKEGEILWETQI